MEVLKLLSFFCLLIAFSCKVEGNCEIHESCDRCVVSEKCMFLLLKNKDQICILKDDFYKFRPRFTYTDLRGCGRLSKSQERAQQNLKSQKDEKSDHFAPDFKSQPIRNETIIHPVEVPKVLNETTLSLTTSTTSTTTVRPRRHFPQRDFKPRGSSNSSKNFENPKASNAPVSAVAKVNPPLLQQTRMDSSPLSNKTQRVEKRVELAGTVFPGSVRNSTAPRWQITDLSPNKTSLQAPLTSMMTLLTTDVNSTPFPIRNDLNSSKKIIYVEGLISTPIPILHTKSTDTVTLPLPKTIYEYVTKRTAISIPKVEQCHSYVDNTGEFPFECSTYKETKIMRFERSFCRTVGLGRIAIYERPNLDIMKLIEDSSKLLNPTRCVLLEWKRKMCKNTGL